MKAAALLVLGLAVLGVGAPAVFRVQTFVIPESRPYGWVTIEYRTPQCPSIPRAWLFETYKVPTSGQLCTSSAEWPHYFLERFRVGARSGETRPLDPNLMIHRAESISEAHPGTGTAGPENAGFHFFYGPTVTGSDPELSKNPRFTTVIQSGRAR